MRELGLDPEDAKTFVLILDGQAFLRSDAAIRISCRLRGAWRMLGAARIIPRPIRDWIYDLFARNRYQWFGRTHECMVPTAEVRARFIDEN
jgi:predicted DCC family thiol-disulfide oxidoreductase YuxK